MAALSSSPHPSHRGHAFPGVHSLKRSLHNQQKSPTKKKATLTIFLVCTVIKKKHNDV